MQITVSMTVDLPASGTIDDIEPLVAAAGARAMRAAVQAACREYEHQVVACPHCRGAALQSEGTDERRLRTSFGRVRLTVRRLRCEGCERRFRPADAFVATLGVGTVTARLRDACTLAGSSWPYRTAALVLRGLCGAEVSPESVRQLSNAAGASEAGAQAEAATRLAAPTTAEVRRERATALRRAAAPSDPCPERLLVGLDSGWVPSCDQAGGMAGKIGVVATEVEPVGRHGRQRLTRRRYVATFGDAAQVGSLA